MTAFMMTVGIGILVCVLGIINMTGNISTLHSYHTKRVKEEDRKPFGKLVGIGTLVMGVAIIVFGAFLFAFEKTQLDRYSVVGTVCLIVGIVVGMSISFYAMKKYNKGIF